LLMFVFCAANFSQAVVSPDCYPHNLKYFSSASEHPWQYDDSYGVRDSLDSGLSRVVIVPVWHTLKAIILIHSSKILPAQGVGEQKATVLGRANQHNNLER
jgi:hypothetical protein